MTKTEAPEKKVSSLSTLAKKPELIKLSISPTPGEELEFYSKDRVKMDTFLRISKAFETTSNMHEEDATNKIYKWLENPDNITLVESLILNEDGTQVTGEDLSLPNIVLVHALVKIAENLGNS